MNFDSNQDNLMNKYFLKPKELAVYCNVSMRTVYRRMENREIPFHKIGGSIRFKREDVEKYFDSVLVESINKKV